VNLFYYLIVEGAMPAEQDRAQLDELLAIRPPERRRDLAKIIALGGEVRR
jgi:hypothetical protein